MLWPLLALLAAGCAGDLPPLTSAPPVVRQAEPRKPVEPPVLGGVPALAPPRLGVPPSLSPFTSRQTPEPSAPPPSYAAPAPGQFGGPPNNGPVTGYGPGGMQPLPGAPPNPPYN